jgi:hypothetical protein
MNKRQVAIVGVRAVIAIERGQLMAWQDTLRAEIDPASFTGIGSSYVTHKGDHRSLSRLQLVEANARLFGDDMKYRPLHAGAVGGLGALSYDYDIYIVAPSELHNGIKVCEDSLIETALHHGLATCNCFVSRRLDQNDLVDRMASADLVIDTCSILLQRAAAAGSGRLVQMAPDKGEVGWNRPVQAAPSDIERAIGWNGVIDTLSREPLANAA